MGLHKTKSDSKGNVEQFKARLVAKDFTQKEVVIMKLSPVSKKDSFRIIMTLVAHYDLELHQMDVKIAFLNRTWMRPSSRHNGRLCCEGQGTFGIQTKKVHLQT